MIVHFDKSLQMRQVVGQPYMLMQRDKQNVTGVFVLPISDLGCRKQAKDRFWELTQEMSLLHVRRMTV